VILTRHIVHCLILQFTLRSIRFQLGNLLPFMSMMQLGHQRELVFDCSYQGA
jgi:hypothetical protein